MSDVLSTLLSWLSWSTVPAGGPPPIALVVLLAGAWYGPRVLR